MLGHNDRGILRFPGFQHGARWWCIPKKMISYCFLLAVLSRPSSQGCSQHKHDEVRCREGVKTEKVREGGREGGREGKRDEKDAGKQAEQLAMKC